MEGELGLCGGVRRRIGRCLCGVEQACCGEAHTPPTRRSPLKRRNLGLHLCLRVLSLHLLLSFSFYLYLISCLVFACHIGKFTVVAYLENLPLCQALNQKSIKNWCSTNSPPSRCPYDPFNWYQSLGSLLGLNRLREYGQL